MRDTPSPISPSPSPQPVTSRTRAGRKRGKSKLDLAGLIGGDSDSSALTQESGDEGIPPTPRDSATITEGGTEYGGDEDTEMHDASPGTSSSPAFQEINKAVFRSWPNLSHQQGDAQEASQKSGNGGYWEDTRGGYLRIYCTYYEEEKEMNKLYI